MLWIGLKLQEQYRKFIKDFAKIAKPLTSLTHHKAKFEWTPMHHTAIMTLRKTIIQVPFLHYLDPTKKYIVYTDALDDACGAQLSQEHDGSILGPLLFLIFCKDIYLNITYSKCILFADDTATYCRHENENYLHQIIEQDITSLLDWFNANKLSLNLLITVSMSFHNNKKITLNIKIDGILISHVENFKFLGLTIDNKLEWNQHFTLLYNKLLINQ